MRSPPPMPETVHELLRDAAQQLIQARDVLLGPRREYTHGLTASLRTIGQVLRAFSLWHGLPAPEDTPLRTLAARAVVLASILETPLRHAVRLEALAADLRDTAGLTVYECEAAEASYYTARNTYFAVLGELPAYLPTVTDAGYLQAKHAAPARKRTCPLVP